MSKPSEDADATVAIEAPVVARERAGRHKAYFTVIRGSGHDLGRYVVVEGPVTVGRGGDVELPLQDHGVSRAHARVEPRPDGSCVLVDLGSKNGTRINAEAVRGGEHPLRDGDKVFVGATVLRFALADDLDLGYQTEVAQIVGRDPLTGLESKRRFDDAMDFALASALARGEPVSLLMMDMDGVKRINDTHGHLFGGHAIGEVGRILQRVIGDRGHACRFGGDEFCAFLPRCPKQEAAELAERIRVAVEGAGLAFQGVALAPTLSIGVATCPEDAREATALLARADETLYRAKRAGKNRVERC